MTHFINHLDVRLINMHTFRTHDRYRFTTNLVCIGERLAQDELLVRYLTSEELRCTFPRLFLRRTGIRGVEYYIEEFLADFSNVRRVITAYELETLHVYVVHVHLVIFSFCPQFSGVTLFRI